MRSRAILRSAFVCPCEAQEVDLEHQADVVEMFVPVALAVIVVVSLRVCQYRLVAFQLEVEYELFEVQWLLYEGVFNQQELVGIGHEVVGLYARGEQCVDAVFCRMAERYAAASRGKFAAECFDGRSDCSECVLECALCDVRRCKNALYAPRLHTLHEVGRCFDIRRAVVDARQHVAVYVGGEA